MEAGRWSEIRDVVRARSRYAFTLNLTVKTVNGTAIAPGDFAALNQVVPVAAQNVGPKYVSVTPKKDGVKEGTAETYSVVVTGGKAAVSTSSKIPGNST